jgi:hypothetical protein
LFILWRSISIQNFVVPRWMVQVLHPPQKFERPPFWNGWRYGIMKYGIEVTLNCMTSLLNFIKIYQLVQKLLGGTHRQTDGQTGDLISLTFLFKGSRLKKYQVDGSNALTNKFCNCPHQNVVILTFRYTLLLL